MKRSSERTFTRYAAPATAASASPLLFAPGPRAPAAQPLRVLVVDDNVDATESLEVLLRIVGHMPAVAYDGLAALALAREVRPQVAILDLGLPGLDGFQLGQALRREGWAKELLLIALTGWNSPADRERTARAGFDHHLTKPADPNELIALFEQRPRAPDPGR